VERGFALEGADGTLTVLPELWSGTRLRMNEGSCDPDGRFYCGSMAYDQTEGAAALHRLDPDGSVQVALDPVTVSNGLDWSPDGSRAYYNDTATFTVAVFDYVATAGLTNRRPFAELPDQGHPDGMTVDADGRVWTAASNGGALYCYSADGCCTSASRCQRGR
jgi:sugar lactone lactonase YvrE